MHTFLMVMSALALLALTAFFNLAEMSLVATRVSRLKKEDEDRAAEKVRTLKQRPGLFLAAIRAGDQLTDLLTGAFVVTWIEGCIQLALHPLSSIGGYVTGIAAVSAFLVVTYVFLVFAGLAPKSLALSAPERWAQRIASPLSFFVILARPFFRLLEISNGLLLRLIGSKEHNEERISESEIRRTFSEGLSSGALMPFERSLMDRVLDLGRRSMRSVMTGRRDLDWLEPMFRRTN